MRFSYSIHTLKNTRQVLMEKVEMIDSDYYKSYDPDRVQMLRDRIKRDIEDIENAIKFLENR